MWKRVKTNTHPKISADPTFLNVSTILKPCPLFWRTVANNLLKSIGTRSENEDCVPASLLLSKSVDSKAVSCLCEGTSRVISKATSIANNKTDVPIVTKAASPDTRANSMPLKIIIQLNPIIAAKVFACWKGAHAVARRSCRQICEPNVEPESSDNAEWMRRRRAVVELELSRYGCKYPFNVVWPANIATNRSVSWIRVVFTPARTSSWRAVVPISAAWATVIICSRSPFNIKAIKTGAVCKPRLKITISIECRGCI
mmetsp:Transcript_17372/g.22898  ORF Transcript_17372/g.22898 Transcript_17372/m.22898 type:complete len:257 (-) Transcript_17372:1425-2195(-)